MTLERSADCACAVGCGALGQCGAEADASFVQLGLPWAHITRILSLSPRDQLSVSSETS